MARMICGRCGSRTAENSTYCPNCRWTLYTETPEGGAQHAAAPTIELPRPGGIFARRRQEGVHSRLERNLRALLDPYIENLEKSAAETAQSEEEIFKTQRALGIAMLLDERFDRAYAHLHRAYQLNPNDSETTLNYATALAERGQLLPALNILKEAREKWPEDPLLLLNLAMIGLQARYAREVLGAIDALEQLWYENAEIAEQYHAEAQTLRGLALLLQEKPGEAKAALEAAASGTLTLQRGGPATNNASATETEATEETPLPDRPFADMEESETDDPDAIEYVTAPDPYSDDGIAEIRQLEAKEVGADLLNNLAMAEAHLGYREEATSRLYAALRIEPSHTRVLNNLGVLAYENGQLPQAFEFLDTARQIEEATGHPNPITSNHLGVVLSAMGRLDEGLARFQRAGSHERAEFEVYYNLGRAYIEQGKPEIGVEHLRHAFKLNPNAPDVYAVLGAAYLLRGRPELLPEAIKQLKRALQLDSRHRVAFADLALALVESDNRNDAAKVIAQALKVHPKSAETLFLLGKLIMEQGSEEHWAKASAQFGAALDTRPDLVASLYNAALCQYLMGFRDTAAQQLQIVTGRDPAFAPAYYLSGVGHAAGKRYQEALVAWQTALKYEPDNVDLHCNIAYIHYIHERWSEAIKHFTTAHRLEPLNADILSAMGLCFARARQFEPAINAFRRSLDINPRSPITHSNIGLAYYLNKQVEKAIEHWRTVAQLDKTYAQKKEEEEQRTFDDSIVTMRPLNWRSRIIRLAPPLPRPHTRLVPGYNAYQLHIPTSDPTLQKAAQVKKELDEAARELAWLNVRH